MLINSADAPRHPSAADGFIAPKKIAVIKMGKYETPTDKAKAELMPEEMFGSPQAQET